MRSLLTVICLLCLVSVSEAAWTELLQKEFPKTPWSQRPSGGADRLYRLPRL